MKRLVIMILTLVLCAGTSALATPSIAFSPDAGTAGGWTYDGAGTLSFNQYVAVDTAMSSNADALVGALVYVPTLSVYESFDGSYTLKPLGSSVLTIQGQDGTIYLKATLTKGDLVPVGTIGAAYTNFTSDIKDVYVTNAGKALGSAALSAIVNSGTSTLDFELSLQGGSGTNYHSLTQMLAGGFVGGNGFSGAMSIPEPATIALLSLGSWALLRKRKT
ncbi:MAG TPA: PEP-CTERM sorting domain-containing protein [Sedimentisphaerales bacterium]|nr:PEP-CTERM sorting domain-containing protein [Sedimentisphaerales bacterium]